MNAKAAYEMGCYVARHLGTQGAEDRKREAETLSGAALAAYQLGRDRRWRMGE